MLRCGMFIRREQIDLAGVYWLIISNSNSFSLRAPHASPVTKHNGVIFKTENTIFQSFLKAYTQLCHTFKLNFCTYQVYIRYIIFHTHINASLKRTSSFQARQLLCLKKVDSDTRYRPSTKFGSLYPPLNRVCH